LKTDTRHGGFCSACKARVYWRVEASGKPNPYDVPKKCPTCKGSGEGDELVQGFFDEKPHRRPCRACGGEKQVQVSHFVTCPNAAAFRKS